MALEIKLIGDPVLRQRSLPLDKVNNKVQNFIKDMHQVMKWKGGIGLAAVQVGTLQRVLIVEYQPLPDDEIKEVIPFTVLINPKIVSSSSQQEEMEEGCLSVPDCHGLVSRATNIEVKALNEKGQSVHFKAEGLKARVIQHELDHLNGVLFTDYLREN